MMIRSRREDELFAKNVELEAEIVRRGARIAELEEEIEKIVSAVVAYRASEGCACCSGMDHKANREMLAKAIGAPPYGDGSGFDFEALNNGRRR